MQRNRIIYVLSDRIKTDFLKIEQKVKLENPLIDTTNCDVYGVSHILFSEELDFPSDLGGKNTLELIKENLVNQLKKGTFSTQGGFYVSKNGYPESILVLNDFNEDTFEETIKHEGTHKYLRKKCSTGYDESFGECLSFACAGTSPNPLVYSSEVISNEFAECLESITMLMKKYPTGVVEFLAKDAMNEGRTKEEKQAFFREKSSNYESSISQFYKILS